MNNFGEPARNGGDGDRKDWPEPTPEMMTGDVLFEAIWQAIKTWDINVPGAYSGYYGATGNHVRAIYDSIMANLEAEIYIWPRLLIDGTHSRWFALLVRTGSGFRRPSLEEQADYNSRDAW
jgi:hypothetical protein